MNTSRTLIYSKQNDPNRQGSQILDAEKDFTSAKAFFGAGLSTALFIEGYPINGVAFISNSCGLIGLLIFLSIVSAFNFGSKRRIVQKSRIYLFTHRCYSPTRWLLMCSFGYF